MSAPINLAEYRQAIQQRAREEAPTLYEPCSCEYCQPEPSQWGRAFRWAGALSIPIYVFFWALWTMLPR